MAVSISYAGRCKLGAALLCLAVVAGAASQARGRLAVDVVITEIADSQAYLVYRYEIWNRAESDWGLVEVELDISADEGMPANLPFTGDHYDFMTERGPAGPHAQVGPISPPGWLSVLGVPARLIWGVPYGARISEDSVAPNESVSGFGIRSTYLPGITRVRAKPTPESCCRDPIPSSPPDEPQYPSPSGMGIDGVAIGPRYRPEQVTLPLIAEQLRTVCSNPLWIDDPQVCNELQGYLQTAAAGLSDVPQSLESTIAVLARNREPQGSIHGNAYWLLSTNVAQLLENEQSRE